MKLLRFLKFASIRTKFILFLLTVFIVLNGVLFVLYPRYVLQDAKSDVTKNIRALVEEQISTTEFSEADSLKRVLVNAIGSRYDMAYIAGSYSKGTFVSRGTLYFYKEIQKLPLNSITEFEQQDVFAIRLEISSAASGNITLWIGLDAEPLLQQERQAFFLALFVLLLSGAIIYASISFFDRVVFVPLKHVINNLRLLSMGQKRFMGSVNNTYEFVQLNHNMDKVAKRFSQLREEVHALPGMLQRYRKEARQYQESLEKELEVISNIGLYLSDLRNEKSMELIFSNLNKEIIARFGFPVSMLFKFESGKFVFAGAHLKGLAVLNKKLNFELKKYIINYHNYLFKNMIESNPIVLENLPFDEILQELNLAGQYAAIPISTSNRIYAFILVGKPGGNIEIAHSELEKMMLLSNTVALHLENLEVVSNLERNVSQRTAELSMSNALLEEANEEKDTMLKIISHDLNAPLRNVMGLIDSINRKYSDIGGDLKDRLNRIRKNIENELQTIDKILNNLRYTETAAALETVNMGQLVETIVEELSYELAKNNVTVEIENDLPDIVANQTFVNHIFLNLIDNACKYLPHGRKSNKIEVRSKIEEKYITFMISDNGKGIPSESQRTIFDYYTRGENDQANKVAGKGLGLALVKNMMGKLGGEIFFDTKINKGTTFFLRFRKIGSASKVEKV